jgi:UDP-2,4-diacetamido-2,4,6-trideoxy-beta-L-altropyranose hydrolase/UDP-4-amino-4,6-dideoxy-N-acetyl-beta-L-altrosamine N-acetyltransferase
MRDLVLASQYPDANITFAVQELEGNINHKIEENNHKLEFLRTNDFEEVDALIKKLDIEMIVIDHYGIDEMYEKQLKIKNPTLKIMSLDDTYERHHCDILLNHNVYADSTKYKDLVPDDCELRCGVTFTLLRDEFVEEKHKKHIRKSDDQKQNIFLAMGGADSANLNIEILKVLETFQNIHVNVVTTTANQHIEELRKYVKGKKNITLHINTSQIASLMASSHFAIVTPSVTVNEIIYMDIPFIAIKTADNQDEMYAYLIKNSYTALPSFDTKAFKISVKTTLESLKIELLNFTSLTLDEKKMVLTWRNHPNIRKCMFTQDKIKLENHLKYIELLKAKDDRVYFLVKRGFQPIGVIDFTNIDHQAKTTEFGIYANPQIKGIGKFLMESIIAYAFGHLHVKTLISEVFEENISAIKLYRRYNFRDTRTRKVNNKKVLQMELNIENR